MKDKKIVILYVSIMIFLFLCDIACIVGYFITKEDEFTATKFLIAEMLFLGMLFGNNLGFYFYDLLDKEN